jgi:hypothetical protein
MSTVIEKIESDINKRQSKSVNKDSLIEGLLHLKKDLVDSIYRIESTKTHLKYAIVLKENTLQGREPFMEMLDIIDATAMTNKSIDFHFITPDLVDSLLEKEEVLI